MKDIFELGKKEQENTEQKKEIVNPIASSIRDPVLDTLSN